MSDLGSVCSQALVCSISDQLLKTTANLVKRMWSRGIQADVLHDPVAPMRITELDVKFIQIFGIHIVFKLILFLLDITFVAFFHVVSIDEREERKLVRL